MATPVSAEMLITIEENALSVLERLISAADRLAAAMERQQKRPQDRAPITAPADLYYDCHACQITTLLDPGVETCSGCGRPIPARLRAHRL